MFCLNLGANVIVLERDKLGGIASSKSFGWINASFAESTAYFKLRNSAVEKSQWRTAFLKIRIDSDVKAESVKRDFERQSQKLQEDGFIHSYEDKVWIVHDEDRHGHTPKGCPVVQRVPHLSCD